MANRLDLQTMLENLIGSRNVYYQPPSSLEMQYPAVVFSRYNIKNDFANNGVYSQKFMYQLTVIDEDPDSEIVYKISKLPTVRFDRHYTSDNLNHDVFILYY